MIEPAWEYQREIDFENAAGSNMDALHWSKPLIVIRALVEAWPLDSDSRKNRRASFLLSALMNPHLRGEPIFESQNSTC